MGSNRALDQGQREGSGEDQPRCHHTRNQNNRVDKYPSLSPEVRWHHLHMSILLRAQHGNTVRVLQTPDPQQNLLQIKQGKDLLKIRCKMAFKVSILISTFPSSQCSTPIKADIDSL